MANLVAEFYIWSLKSQTNISDKTIGCHIYHEKAESGSSLDQSYADERQQYAEGRGIVWTLRNRRPEKLREAIKEVEDCLSQYQCIQSCWLSRRQLQLLLQNGTIITFILGAYNGGVDKILIDKTLVGRLASDLACDGVLTNSWLIIAHPDKTLLDFVYFMKRPMAGESKRRLEKILQYEPKLFGVDVPGPSNRRLRRHVTCNLSQDMILLWWPTASDDAWPWSPQNSDMDRVNMVLMTLNGPRLTVQCASRTEFDPVDATFSSMQANMLHTLERSPGSGGEVRISACTYEVTPSRILRTSLVNIPLQSELVSQAWGPGEDRLLLACQDGTLALFDRHKKSIQRLTTNIMPRFLSWHPRGTIFCVASEKADLQVYDIGMSPVSIQLLSEECHVAKPCINLASFFRLPMLLNELHWCPHMVEMQDNMVEQSDALLVIFERGPLGVLHVHHGTLSQEKLSPLDVLRSYIRRRDHDSAMKLLLSLDWNTDAAQCYACMMALFNHLLRLPLNADREGYLQTILGAFYSPKIRLSENTILEYREPVSRLARRFFHHLLRYARFDMAFLLAVDIGARDLFIDIYYLALDKGETTLAEVAREKAEELESASIESLESEVDELSSEGEEEESTMTTQAPASPPHATYQRRYGSHSRRHEEMVDEQPPSQSRQESHHHQPNRQTHVYNAQDNQYSHYSQPTSPNEQDAGLEQQYAPHHGSQQTHQSPWRRPGTQPPHAPSQNHMSPSRTTQKASEQSQANQSPQRRVHQVRQGQISSHQSPHRGSQEINQDQVYSHLTPHREGNAIHQEHEFSQRGGYQGQLYIQQSPQRVGHHVHQGPLQSHQPPQMVLTPPSVASSPIHQPIEQQPPVLSRQHQGNAQYQPLNTRPGAMMNGHRPLVASSPQHSQETHRSQHMNVMTNSQTHSTEHSQYYNQPQNHANLPPRYAEQYSTHVVNSHQISQSQHALARQEQQAVDNATENFSREGQTRSSQPVPQSENQALNISQRDDASDGSVHVINFGLV